MTHWGWRRTTEYVGLSSVELLSANCTHTQYNLYILYQDKNKTRNYDSMNDANISSVISYP